MAEILLSVLAYQLALMTADGALDDRFGSKKRGRVNLGLFNI
jgi:hypothetical protein